MRIIHFEAAEWRGPSNQDLEHRLVLYTSDNIHQKPESRSRYEHEHVSGVISWKEPFGGPITVNHHIPAFQLFIALREKPQKRPSWFRKNHGSDIVSFTLRIGREYTSEVIRLQPDPHQRISSPELVLTVTTTGLRDSPPPPHRLGEVAAAPTTDPIASNATTSPTTAASPPPTTLVVGSSTAADSTVIPARISHTQSSLVEIVSEPNPSESPVLSKSEQASTSSPHTDEQALLYSQINEAHVVVKTAAVPKSESPKYEVPLSQLAGNEAASGFAGVVEATGDALQSLDLLVDILDKVAEINPFVKAAWGVVRVAYDLRVQQSEHDENVDKLYEAMDANCRLAVVLARNVLTSEVISILRSILEAISEAARIVKEYRGIRASAFSSVKLAASSITSRVQTCLESLDALQRQLGNYTLASIQSNVQDVLRILSRGQHKMFNQLSRLDEDLLARMGESLLNEMPYAPEADRALRSSHGGCLPDTRVEIIQAIVDWATGSPSDSAPSYIRGLNRDSRVLWLCGVAGSGKSSIAISVARALQAKQRLGALYEYKVAYQDSLNPKSLFSTIARQRAKRNPDFRRELVRMLEPMDLDQRATTSPSEQFRRLLALSASNKANSSNDVIIIDAFDESAKINDADRLAALEVLSPSSDSAIPHHLRFIVTSRLDTDVAKRLEPLPPSRPPSVAFVKMEEIEHTHTVRDIKLYVEHQLQGEEDLLDAAEQITQLAIAADESFQWASTACAYITEIDQDGEKDAGTRLSEILLLGTSPSLDILYCTILDQHFAISIGKESPTLRWILGALVCSAQPVSAQVIAELASTHAQPNSEAADARKFLRIARKLASLVTGTDSITSPLIPLHTSFVDFLQSEKRSGVYAVPLSETDLHFALGSIRVMSRSLRFNICGLETSFLRNDAVPDLAERIKKHVPDELSYACHFWPAHVAGAFASTSPETAFLRRSLDGFLRHKLLVLAWVEVMSLTRTNAHESLGPLSSLQTENRDLSDLIRFTAYFSVPVSISVPHIYLSALAFAPTSSLMIAPVSTHFPDLVRSSTPLTSWPQIRQTFVHQSEVTCVAFSPSGRWVVSGGKSGEISLWDVYSGSPILPRMSTSWAVKSIAISPDGRLLASGSAEGIIQLWDMRTLSSVGEPVQAHTDSLTTTGVESVRFSPDGKLLTSGSWDHTIRLWELQSGLAVLRASGTQKGNLCAIAVSPDGKLLASWSWHKISLWDVPTLSPIGEPLSGHTSSVRSVAFSPDGTLLVSSSYDKTIRFWNVHTRSAVGEPLSAHDASINSVVFSPDGQTLASCSDHNKVQLWDIKSRSPLGDPLTGHTGKVCSIVFSPDGSLLASGSADKTVHVWDTSMLVPNRESPAPRFQIQNFAAFSPDGKRLASGSDGNAIQLWDVHSVIAVGEPLRRHTFDIKCVAFSPDGALLASGSHDYTVQLWDMRTGSAVGEPLRGHSNWVSALAFSPDGKLLASASWDETIRFWDADARSAFGEPLTGLSNSWSDWATSVSFSPDGLTLASGNYGGTVRLWNVQTRSPIGRALGRHPRWVRCVTFSPDGTILASGSDDKDVCLWNVRTQSAIGKPLTGHTTSATTLAFSPDGTLLASCSETDSIVLVWHVRVPSEVGAPVVLLRHESVVYFIAFSSASPILSSITSGGVVRKWDLGYLLSTQTANVHSSPKDSFQNHSSSLALLPPDLGPLPPDHLVNLEDGWVVGPKGELILWIPPTVRPSLADLRENERFGGSLTTLDFTKFVCGTDWTKCYSPPFVSTSNL